MRIVQVANASSTGATDLLDAVQFDTALAARIMRTVNSSLYRRRFPALFFLAMTHSSCARF